MSFQWSGRENFCGRIAGLLVLGGLVSDVAVPGVAADWKYVVPAAKSEQFPPIFRAVFLSDERPVNLTEQLEYRGTRRRYAQLRYGSPNSVRVTIVLDQRGPDQVDLHVDGRLNALECTGSCLLREAPREPNKIRGSIFNSPSVNGIKSNVALAGSDQEPFEITQDVYSNHEGRCIGQNQVLCPRLESEDIREQD